MNIKEPMFFDNFKLQKEYTFNRMKDSVSKIKQLDQEESSANETLSLIYKTEISVLIPLAQWFNNMVDLDFWQTELLQEAGKLIWKE